MTPLNSQLHPNFQLLLSDDSRRQRHLRSDRKDTRRIDKVDERKLVGNLMQMLLISNNQILWLSYASMPQSHAVNV